MTTPTRLARLLLAAACTMATVACGGSDDTPATPPRTSIPLEGTATANGRAMSGATITVLDRTGATRSTQADAEGRYSVDAGGLAAPLLLVANQPNETHTLQLASVVANTTASGTTRANINPLTDRIASEVAGANGLKGVPALVEQGNTAAITPAQVQAATDSTRALVLDALQAAGVSGAAAFDPAAAPMTDASSRVLALLRSNRGYESATGRYTSTELFDQRYQPLSSRRTLQYETPLSAFAGTTIYVVGDSTASNYDSQVAPREGWGQRFHEQLADGAAAQVVNVAQSGRSSRSFINEGWFQQVRQQIKAGDYLFIQFGHNDEKCGGSNPPVARDEIDIANLCTYPGTAPGIAEVSASRPGQEYSFRQSLRKYVDMARASGATPVLLTPVTRRQSNGSFKPSHITTKGAFPGDYSAAVLAVAAEHDVAVLDIDATSIAFFNALPDVANDSLKYYLAVSEQAYPYYTPATTGNIAKPDNTHFQTLGAQTLGNWVASGVKASSRADLAALKAVLK
jgi:lysophospholipase L1-like esterase